MSKSRGPMKKPKLKNSCAVLWTVVLIMTNVCLTSVNAARLGSISGQVTDEYGIPVRNVIVTAHFYYPESDYLRYAVATRSLVDGSYVLYVPADISGVAKVEFFDKSGRYQH